MDNSSKLVGTSVFFKEKKAQAPHTEPRPPSFLGEVRAYTDKQEEQQHPDSAQMQKIEENVLGDLKKLAQTIETLKRYPQESAAISALQEKCASIFSSGRTKEAQAVSSLFGSFKNSLLNKSDENSSKTSPSAPGPR